MSLPSIESTKSLQVARAFGYQWAQRQGHESKAVLEWEREWMLESYCQNDAAAVQHMLPGEGCTILDCGCGAGISALALFGDLLQKHHYYGVDISEAVLEAEQKFVAAGYPGTFCWGDLMAVPLNAWPTQYDLILLEGVLPFVDDPAATIRHLASLLKTGGFFLFYAYAKMPLVRTFTDWSIHHQLEKMSDEAAWKALLPLTKLGIALGALGQLITIPEDIPLLGIKAGTYDLQRFVYHHLVKAFYHPEFSLEEMNLQNFDNFRPEEPIRHTLEEVFRMCKESGLLLENVHSTLAGHSVVARKFP